MLVAIVERKYPWVKHDSNPITVINVNVMSYNSDQPNSLSTPYQIYFRAWRFLGHWLVIFLYGAASLEQPAQYNIQEPRRVQNTQTVAYQLRHADNKHQPKTTISAKFMSLIYISTGNWTCIRPSKHIHCRHVKDLAHFRFHSLHRSDFFLFVCPVNSSHGQSAIKMFAYTNHYISI